MPTFSHSLCPNRALWSRDEIGCALGRGCSAQSRTGISSSRDELRTMSLAGTLAVFALGMRHGADPDHFAAIDNVTRNAYAARQRHGRLSGLFFAAGHSAMVLFLAVVLSMLSATVAARAHWLETAGNWVSVAILLAMASLNVANLLGRNRATAGIRMRLLPALLRNSGNPLVACPIGMLFGLGFETSSQIAAYGIAFSQAGGALAGLAVGVAFCGGLILSDALDGVIVHHLVAHRSSKSPGAVRIWLSCVTIVALAVAAYELGSIFALPANEATDLAFGLAIVLVLLLVFWTINARKCLREEAS